jgi:hypothetical protein
MAASSVISRLMQHARELSPLVKKKVDGLYSQTSPSAIDTGKKTNRFFLKEKTNHMSGFSVPKEGTRAYKKWEKKGILSLEKIIARNERIKKGTGS